MVRISSITLARMVGLRLCTLNGGGSSMFCLSIMLLNGGLC